MAQFERLQELWQGQEAPLRTTPDTSKLTRSLRVYGRRQHYFDIGKAVLVSSVLGWSLADAHASLPVISGLALIAVAAAALLIQDWRSQRAIARLDFSEPSLEFVRSTIARILEQRDPCRRYYWPFMGSMVIGMNLMLAGPHRLWLRILASTMPFLAFELGLWVRHKRFEAQCRPLLDELAQLRTALEERVQ
jgi:hypothetical protein